MGANSTVDSIDSYRTTAVGGEREPVAAATDDGDVEGASAVAHASVGQLAARLVVAQVPSGGAGSSPARRIALAGQLECPPRCQRGDRRFESGRERVAPMPP